MWKTEVNAKLEALDKAIKQKGKGKDSGKETKPKFAIYGMNMKKHDTIYKLEL